MSISLQSRPYYYSKVGHFDQLESYKLRNDGIDDGIEIEK